MEFRLIYQGPLVAEQWGQNKPGRAKEKHALRKHFHSQLRELWKQHPDLRELSHQKFYRYTTPSNLLSGPGPGVRIGTPVYSDTEDANAKTWLEHIADDNIRCNGNRFVPLISKDGGFTCALDILFLRRDNPGNLIDSQGDIDNRIKVLFDGLKMPRDVKELGGHSIDADEDPFFCLLEDDSLITRVSITTDRLVIPQKEGEDTSHVLLLIHVTMLNPSLVFGGERRLI